MEIDDKKQYHSNVEFLSNSSRDLLAQMMHEDPIMRPTIDDVLAHDWIT